MTRRPLVATLAVAAVGLAPLVLTPPTEAATAADLASAVVADPGLVSGSQLVSDPSGGRSSMVATTELAGFPTDGGSFAILSTGTAAAAYQSNASGNLTTDFGGRSRGSGNDRDVTVLRIDVEVPAGVNCMTGVDFRFLSEEFPEYVGDSFNDAFIAELDSTTWTASGSNIDAPGNFAFDANRNVVSINAAGAATMSVAEAAGTTYDGSTALLSAATPITPGPHSLYFSIFDQGDASYDSTVMIDNMRFGTVADVATDCKPGATVAAEPPALTLVSAERPEVSDTYGTARDTYTIPTTTGVVYSVDGVVKPAGTYPAAGTVTVTAAAEDGYQLTGPESFDLVFSATEATHLSSSGTGTEQQSVRPEAPVGAGVTLLDPDGAETSSVTVPGEGTYTLTDDGIVFEPALGFSGVATGVTFRITDQGEASEATYRPSVAKPAGPSADAKTSTGTGTAAQHTTVEVPVGGSLSLRDAQGHDVTEIVDPAVGTYRVDQATNQLTFAPALGFSGPTPAVGYAVTDAYAQTATGTYQPSVAKPAAPNAATLTSTGTGTDTQHTAVDVPVGATLVLRTAAGEDATQVELPGTGTYVVDQTTRTILFLPAAGHLGAAPRVGYAITDAYGQTATGTYQPSVQRPSAPTTTSVTSVGSAGKSQEAFVTVPAGGSVTLIDPAGRRVDRVTVKGQGTYRVDATTGRISFTPLRGFEGPARRVPFWVVDAYGQHAAATYAARVDRSPRAALTAPTWTRKPASIPAVCKLTATRIRSCEVTAFASVGGERVAVGRGVARNVNRSSVAVPVRLGKLGRALAARPGGARLSLVSRSRAAGETSYFAQATSRVVAATVRLRPVYFDTDQHTLRRVDERYLRQVSTAMGRVARVVCVGYADARASVRYNARLARDRAKSACAVVAGRSNVATQLISRGERRPAASNATGNGRALNRRVEIQLRY